MRALDVHAQNFAMEQKSVFISYRRAVSRHLARSIYQDLKMNGWDVFLDVTTIDSGDFDRIILNQIGARAHFILLISSGSLERCVSSGDWLRQEIEQAVHLGRNIVPIVEEGADFNREMSYLPSDLRDIVSKKNALPMSHFFFDAAVEILRTRFLKTPEYIQITETPPDEHAEVQRRMAILEAEIPSAPPGTVILPAPFTWIRIPDKNYSVAKYPTTNGQFDVFKRDGGYHNEEWWLQSGWEERVAKNWKAPRYWHDPKWNGATLPVVGVSWYEAVAYSRWLSRKLNERIELPTEEQWLYAAEGDDPRPFPWGKSWNADRCNSSAGTANWGQTSPVTKYQNIGDSPFGVVDMLGNVWEWCLEWDESKKPLRGGSWRSKTLTIQKRIQRRATLSFNLWGFRLVKYHT